MKRSNRWNRFTYRLWAPAYDWFVEAPVIARARRQAIEWLDLRRGERVLLVGVGTGADLRFLPPGTRAVGIDLSPDMLARAKKKLPLPDREISLGQADAESLPFESDSFDAAILTLILSVVPDGRQCLAEALRAVRPDGRLLVFDKFLGDDQPARWTRRLLNLLTSVFGTDINRRFGDLSEGLGMTVFADRSSLFGGVYRAILLQKEQTPRAHSDTSERS